MSEKKYNRQTYTGLGTGMQDRLIKGAYLSARADAPDYSWMNVVGSGVKSFKEQVDGAKANKTAEREKTIAGIQTTVDSIYETGGSLPQGYFDQAFNYTEQLREEYIAAVESGDVKAQHQIKGKLNGFSTSIQTTKTSLTSGAELWKDSSLIDESGMTDYQLAVNASFKEENAQLIEGVYQWKNVNHDPSNPKSKEFFTLDDYKEALPLRDDVNKEVYLSSNKKVLDARQKWLDGEGGEFDLQTQLDANTKIIDQSIKEVGSMQSMVHDNITGQGSFASSLKDNPEFQSIFDVINNKDGLKNQTAIALYDTNNDGTVDFRDYIDYEDPSMRSYLNKYFDEQGSIEFSDGISEEERAFMRTPEFLEEITEMMETEEYGGFKSDIETLAKENLSNAILDKSNDNYNEDVTKSLLAGFMTNRQRQMFYGKDGDMYKSMVPNPGGRRKDSENYYRKGKLVINGETITSLDQYKKMGGSYQYLKDVGYTWDEGDGEWFKSKSTFKSGAPKYGTN